MKSKIKIIHSEKEWTGDNGTIYYHNLEMENGDKINIGKKKKLAVGEDLSYELTGQDGTSEFPKAKTPKDDSYSPGGGKSNPEYVKGIEVGHAINNAVNMMCAGVELDTVGECKTNEEKIYESAKVIMAISNRLKSE